MNEFYETKSDTASIHAFQVAALKKSIIESVQAKEPQQDGEYEKQ